MRNLMNPRWLIIINTIPVILLAAIYFGAYQIIHTLLSEDSIRLWMIFGGALFFLWINTLIYALLSIRKKKNIHALYGLISLVFHIPFLYAFGRYLEYIIPFSIPTWMLPDNMILYVGSFLMPTLAHALLSLIVGLTPPREGSYRSWKNFALAFSIPLLWYLFMQIIFPLWRPYNSRLGEHTVIIAVLASTTIFLLFLGRGIYILAQKRGARWKEYQLLWKIPFTIIFPLIGLALNNGLLNESYLSFDGIFGDFGSPWFYILAILNGLVLCLPRPAKATPRLLLFAWESITFSYTLYFFLVFIPFLPLSVIAIIGFGLGFLLLSPLVLMVIHSIELGRDFRFLQQYYSRKKLLAIIALGTAFIPFSICLNYVQDRAALREALTYVYQSDYDKMPEKKISTRSLQRVIKMIRAHKKDQRGSGVSIGQTPFLSPLYNWLVLDNLTLSETKINHIEEIFFGLSSSGFHQNTSRIMPTSDRVMISDVQTQATYDPQQKSWRTWVDLEITNFSDSQKEFVTHFDLPEGAWVSDYYLWIAGEKVPGILAEKKTATWVYRQIVSRRRDPGILYYLEGNTVAFRVFPFSGKETRKTGFEILHKEPLVFDLGGQRIQLGDPNLPEANLSETVFSANEKVVYIPEALKNTLSEVQRKEYYHFIVDCSIGKDSLLDFYISTIEELAQSNPDLIKNAQISFTNTYNQTFSFEENWQQKLAQQKFSGGFYLERSIKEVLTNPKARASLQIPKIIVLSSNIDMAVLPHSFTDFTSFFPEVDYFQVIDTEQNVLTFSLEENTRISLSDSMISPSPKVLAWPNATSPKAFISASPGPAVVLLDSLAIVTDKLPRSKNWGDALELEGRYQSYYLYPGNKDEEWLPMVKNSLSAYILTPLMSFISLENEAQRTALRKKQEQVLKGNVSLDLDEEAHKMSEPSLFICMGILILWGIWFRRKNPLFLRFR